MGAPRESSVPGWASNFPPCERPSTDNFALNGTEIPWRLHFQNLRVTFFHGQLQKVAVMLKVKRKTELCED